jgi:hypothetical protein
MGLLDEADNLELLWGGTSFLLAPIRGQTF